MNRYHLTRMSLVITTASLQEESAAGAYLHYSRIPPLYQWQARRYHLVTAALDALLEGGDTLDDQLQVPLQQPHSCTRHHLQSADVQHSFDALAY